MFAGELHINRLDETFIDSSSYFPFLIERSRTYDAADKTRFSSSGRIEHQSGRGSRSCPMTHQLRGLAPEMYSFIALRSGL